MVRVHERYGASAPSAAVLHRRAAPKWKHSYKVIFEEVGGKQKKLKTLLHTKAQAPNGYTFIPAGDPQITNRCKQIAKDEGLTVYIVSTSTNPNKALSLETHRVGYHFPSVTVEKACNSLGVSLTASGRVVESHLATLDEGYARAKTSNRQPAKKKKRSGACNELPTFDIQSLSQAVIDTQAREAIKDLFPNIPADDLHLIVRRSFQKGQGLVGTADGMSLVRRAQLAVIAHIRHVYTPYDALLRQGSWQQARQQVEQPCLDKLIQWRGDEDDVHNVDEMLREVIVIDDDDDDEENAMQDGSSALMARAKRNSSVEIILADNLQTQTVDYATTKQTGDTGRLESPNSEGGELVEYQALSPSRHGQQLQFHQGRHDRLEAHRHRLWEEARNRRRKAPETCVVDNSNDLPATGMMAKAPPYSTHCDYRQTYTPELPHPVTEVEAHQTSRASVYMNLIPLPRDMGHNNVPQSYGRGPVPRQDVSSQVIYTDQQQQAAPIRRPAGSNHIYYTGNPQPPQFQPHQPDVQRPPRRSSEEGTRFVIDRKPARDASNTLYTRSQQLGNRNTEMILPSIEGNLANAREQQNLVDARPQRVNLHGLGDITTGEQRQDFMSNKAYVGVHNESPPINKRKFDDRQLGTSYSREPRILVPLDDRDSYQVTRERPPEAVQDIDMRPFVSDNRIVPLPPREVVGYQGGQGRIQTGSRHGVIDDQSIHRPPREYLQIPLPSTEASRQPTFLSQSLSCFNFAQPISAYEFPTALNAPKPALSYREVIDPSSRYASGIVAGDDKSFADFYAVSQHPRRLENVGRDTRTEFRDMSLDDRQRRDDDSGVRKERGAEHNKYAASQMAPGRNHPSSMSHADPHHGNPEERREIIVIDSPLQSRNVHQHPSTYDRPSPLGDETIETSDHYMQRDMKPHGINPFERHHTQPVRRPAAEQWLDL